MVLPIALYSSKYLNQEYALLFSAVLAKSTLPLARRHRSEQ